MRLGSGAWELFGSYPWIMTATDDIVPTRPEAKSILSAEYRRLTLGIVAVVFLVAFEAMAVSTALPVAVRSLNGLPLYGIAFSAFLTTSLFAMVLAGERSDARGPVLPLLGGIGAFGVGLLLAGTATTMPVFVLGRAVQGFGAGLIIVALYVVVARAYPEDTRPRVFSAMSGAWVLPSIVGPVAAGFVTEQLSWRWVFLAVLALVVPAVAVMLPGLRRLDGPTEGAVRRAGRLRLALGTAFGIAVLQYAGQHPTVLGAVLALAALALVVPTVSRLLPPGTLRAARGLPTVILMRGLLAGAFFGAEAFIPLMFVAERGLSPTLAGMTLTGSGLSWSVGSWYQGRPGLRVARSALVQVGAALVAAGTAAASLGLWAVLPPAVAAAGWCLAGLGMGLGLTSLSVLLFELSPPAEQGVNSAAMQIADVLLATLTIAAGGSLFAALHTRPGRDAGVFVLIFLLMCGIGLVGTAVAPRVRTRGGAVR
jgi:MFS family permease